MAAHDHVLLLLLVLLVLPVAEVGQPPAWQQVVRPRWLPMHRVLPRQV
jgi:hypothetical protein